ncbi:MAG: hypothetical protein GXP62_19890 [Oligoflexia bacterium]|nr:hypothetical protein [Oligoflexia bacterium]
MTLPLALFLACANATSGGASAVPVSAETTVADLKPGLTQRRRIDLNVGTTVTVPELQLSVTLVSAKDSLYRQEGGKKGHRVTGTLHLEQGDQVIDQAFRSGQAFEAFGHPMAVFGTSGWLELSVFPPGATVMP